MNPKKRTSGLKKAEHGRTDAEREARFQAIAASVKTRLAGRPKKADHHPAGPTVEPARALGIARRAARIRPPD
jgi:hypothetical protein